MKKLSPITNENFELIKSKINNHIQNNERKAIIFILWILGFKYAEIGKILNLNYMTISDLIKTYPLLLDKWWKLSQRTLNCLKANNYRSREEIRIAILNSKFKMENMKNFGIKSYNEVLEWIGLLKKSSIINQSKSKVKRKCDKDFKQLVTLSDKYIHDQLQDAGKNKIFAPGNFGKYAECKNCIVRDRCKDRQIMYCPQKKKEKNEST